MARHGFIHDKLDIKFLILYIMARVASPIDFHATLWPGWRLPLTFMR